MSRESRPRPGTIILVTCLEGGPQALNVRSRFPMPKEGVKKCGMCTSRDALFSSFAAGPTVRLCLIGWCLLPSFAAMPP